MTASRVVSFMKSFHPPDGSLRITTWLAFSLMPDIKINIPEARGGGSADGSVDWWDFVNYPIRNFFLLLPPARANGMISMSASLMVKCLILMQALLLI